MDIRCCNCNTAWDDAHLYNLIEVPHTLLRKQGWHFGPSFFVVLRCPQCRIKGPRSSAQHTLFNTQPPIESSQF